MFTRGGTGIKVAQYKIYCDNILIPFIKQTSEEFPGWKDGYDIPSYPKAIYWSYENLSQIDTIVEPESFEIYHNKLITANTQKLGCTETEQPADLTNTFCVMKQLNFFLTLHDVPAERHPIKNVVTKVFTTLRSEGHLFLKKNKSRALIDFIASHPEMTAKAVTRNNVLHGFHEAGYIDRKMLRYPDIDKILGTCLQKATSHEYSLCLKQFPLLLRMYLENGHVDDSVFEKLGVPMDQDPEGNQVRRDAGIQQELCHCTKILTIEHQHELCAAVKNAI